MAVLDVSEINNDVSQKRTPGHESSASFFIDGDSPIPVRDLWEI